MKLTPAKSHMYPWCDFTANPLAGRCPHDCDYCYMKNLKMYSQVKGKYSGPQRVSWRDLEEPTGKHDVRRREDLPFVPGDALVIFVCSGNDLGTAPREAKIEILEDCGREPRNYYLLQSKNPAGFKEVEERFPPNTILGTTVETNRGELLEEMSSAPSPRERIDALNEFDGKYWKMISIEPKMDCDPAVFSKLIQSANPDFVSVGADRGGKHNLPEPDQKTLLELIHGLVEFTIVYRKENLDRLLKGAEE